MRLSMVSPEDVASGNAHYLYPDDDLNPDDDDYPLTWPQALRAAKDGSIIECANVINGDDHKRGRYNPTHMVVMDAEAYFYDVTLWLSSADIDAGWRVVPQDSEEGRS